MDLGEEETSEEAELKRLLKLVSGKGLKALDLIELDRLRTLLQAKEYSGKKAQKSKSKLLKQINLAFYDSQRPRKWF